MSETVKVYKLESYDAPLVNREYVPVYEIDEDNYILTLTGDPSKVLVNEKRWPIKYYQWANGKEMYVAIDPELSDILEIEIATDAQWQDKISAIQEQQLATLRELDLHHKKLEQYSKATFLQRLKYLFTRKI